MIPMRPYKKGRRGLYTTYKKEFGITAEARRIGKLDHITTLRRKIDCDKDVLDEIPPRKRKREKHWALRYPEIYSPRRR